MNTLCEYFFQLNLNEIARFGQFIQYTLFRSPFRSPFYVGAVKVQNTAIVFQVDQVGSAVE